MSYGKRQKSHLPGCEAAAAIKKRKKEGALETSVLILVRRPNLHQNDLETAPFSPCCLRTSIGFFSGNGSELIPFPNEPPIPVVCTHETAKKANNDPIKPPSIPVRNCSWCLTAHSAPPVSSVAQKRSLLHLSSSLLSSPELIRVRFFLGAGGGEPRRLSGSWRYPSVSPSQEMALTNPA